RPCRQARSAGAGWRLPCARGGRCGPGGVREEKGESGLMNLREFRKVGHAPSLVAAFLYFDVSFMIWVMLGPLGPFIGEALKLSATQKGFLTAVPLLGGSFFRPILGWMTERFGGRRTGLIGLAMSLVPLFVGWRFASSFN